jgi:hypothetical protein
MQNLWKFVLKPSNCNGGHVVEYDGDALIGVPLYPVKGIDSQTEESINERCVI